MKARWLAGTGAIAAAALISTGLFARPGPDTYVDRRLTSDLPSFTPNVDPELVHPWGVAAGPDGVWMVSHANALAKLYASSGQPAVIPGSGRSIRLPQHPTGIAVNPTAGFVVASRVARDPSRLVFASLRGTISGWSPTVAGRDAIVAVDASARAARYTGLAIFERRGGAVLYAADFNNGVVDVYDETWAHLGAFTDPSLPRGLAPFNVAIVGDRLFVAFARKDADGEGALAGPGLGVVEEFHPNGALLRVVARGPRVDAPWAMVMAPPGFAGLSGALLVGNAGDGTIAAWDGATGRYLGHVSGRGGSHVEEAGLLGLGFAPVALGSAPVLFYGAAIDDGTHGLLGAVHAQR